MPVLSQLTVLTEAYSEALNNPRSAISVLGLQPSSTRDEVAESFIVAFNAFSPSGMECDEGRKRFLHGVDLFVNEAQIPDFVARYIAEIVLLQQVSPP